MLDKGGFSYWSIFVSFSVLQLFSIVQQLGAWKCLTKCLDNTNCTNAQDLSVHLVNMNDVPFPLGDFF